MKDMLPSEQIKAAITQHTYGILYAMVVLIAMLLGFYKVAIVLEALAIGASFLVIYKLNKLYKNPMLYLANLEALAGKDAPN